MKRLNSDFQTKYISETGTELTNRDYFGFVELDGYVCWAIAESFDQDLETKSAQLAVHTVIDLFTKKPTLSRRKLQNYVMEAHRQLKRQSANFQLKASILIVVSDYKKIRYVSCGNGRFFIFRGDTILLKSREQSLYQKMLDANQVSPNSENGIQESRNLIDYLGKSNHPNLYTSPKSDLEDEDILFLATWGFWEKMSEVELLDALEEAKTPEGYLDNLQDLYLSKQDGTVNNHTAAAVFVQKTFKTDDTKRKKIVKSIVAVAIILLVIGTIIGITYTISTIKHNQKVNTITEYEQQGDLYIEDQNFDRAITEYDEAAKSAKQLKEKKGKKGKVNQEIKKNMSLKQRVTQLLISGSAAYKEQEYDKTIEEFNQALQDAKGNMDFYDKLPLEEIEKIIQEAKDGQYIYDLSDIADIQAEANNYTMALKNLLTAKNLAKTIGNRDLEKEMTIQYEELQAEQQTIQEEKMQKQIDKQTKVAESMALDADTFAQAGDYASAIITYGQAIEAYKEIEDYEKASAMNQKIIDLQTQMTEEENQNQSSIADGYVKLADAYLEKEKFGQARTTYNRAKNIYNKLGDAEKIKEVNILLERVEELKAERQLSIKQSKINDIVSDAEIYLEKENYTNAKQKYKQAQVLYQGLNSIDKVLEIKEQIKLIETLEALEEKQKEEALKKQQETGSQ